MGACAVAIPFPARQGVEQPSPGQSAATIAAQRRGWVREGMQTHALKGRDKPGARNMTRPEMEQTVCLGGRHYCTALSGLSVRAGYRAQGVPLTLVCCGPLGVK